MTTTSNAETTAPFGTLMTLVIALLAPMFLGVTNGDVALAKAAAIETVNDYRAKNSVGLIAVAQIIAFGLAAVGSLSLSMDDNISVQMALRLRSNANACDRSAQRNVRALKAAQTLEESKEAEESAAFQDAMFADRDLPEPEVLLSQQAERLLAAEAEARLQDNPVGRAPARTAAAPTRTAPTNPSSNQQEWAAAMAREADKINAGISHLPPNQRPAASIRANALSTTASSILCAAAAPALFKTGTRTG